MLHNRRVPRAFTAVLGAWLIAGFAQTAAAQSVFEGVTGEGAHYRIDMPAEWNGSLVVYAHGIVSPEAPIALPDTEKGYNLVRDAIVSQGFATIASSFSENGYAVKDATQRTHQLKGLFTAQFGAAARTYLVGHSLGAVAILKLAEQYPSQYSGALPMCGFIGGGVPETGYLANARVLFDYFFPGVLPGDAFTVPPVDFSPGSPTFNLVYSRLVAGLYPPEYPTIRWAAMAGLPGNSPTEIITTGLNVVGYSLGYTNDLLDRTHGRIPFDNSLTNYGDPAVNAGVDRFSSSPDAVNYVEKYYTPTGHLSIPVLTLHTMRDPVVPFFHEDLYLGKVTAAGRLPLLVQRSVDAYGHCTMTAAQTLDAFGALVEWVETGQVPAGGAIQ